MKITIYSSMNLIQEKNRELLIIYMKRMKVDPSLTACTNVNSKCIKDLNKRPKTVKHSGKNIGKMFS